MPAAGIMIMPPIWIGDILGHDYLKPDGSKWRNTDIFTFQGDQIIRLEVYFGWSVGN